MKTANTKALKRAALAFCIFGGGLMLFKFGSYYFGVYGFSLAPFQQDRQGLWQSFSLAGISAVRGGVAAAIAIYLATKLDQRKSNDAASQIDTANRR